MKIQRALVHVAICSALVAGCSVAGTSGAPVSKGPSPGETQPAKLASPLITHAESSDSEFVMSIDLPKGIWHATETITAEVRLKRSDGDATQIGASGAGPFAFSIEEVGGSRRVRGIWNLDCSLATVPLTMGLLKSGPLDSDFARDFLTAAGYSLPIGVWRIKAMASFNDKAGCQGTTRDLQATVELQVIP